MARAQTAKIARAQAAYDRQRRGRFPSCKGGFVICLSPELDQVRIVPMLCRKWSCSFCAPIKLRKLRLDAHRGSPERHIVLNLVANPARSLPQNVAYLRKCFVELVRVIRREFVHFQYMSVMELHKSGMPHLHLLQHGTYIPFKWLSRTWLRISGSWNVHLGAVHKRSNAINELTKYLAKTAGAFCRKLVNVKIVSRSKHYFRNDDEPPPDEPKANWVCYFSRGSLDLLADLAQDQGLDLVPDDGCVTWWKFQPSRSPPLDPAPEPPNRHDELIRDLWLFISSCKGSISDVERDLDSAEAARIEPSFGYRLRQLPEEIGYGAPNSEGP